jgi:hypothetical protein
MGRTIRRLECQKREPRARSPAVSNFERTFRGSRAPLDGQRDRESQLAARAVPASPGARSEHDLETGQDKGAGQDRERFR